jgi:drug/metabolite transporter (DMT)-like permease
MQDGVERAVAERGRAERTGAERDRTGRDGAGHNCTRPDGAVAGAEPGLFETALGHVAMALVAVTAGVAMDVLAKAAAVDAPAAQMTLLRWIYGMLILVPLMVVMKVRPGSLWRPIHLARAVLNLVGSFCLYFSLAHLPLSLVVAVFFLEPLAAMALAAFFLGEKMSRSCLIGICVAVAGILVMTGTADWRFDPLLGVAVLGALSWGTMLVLTRSVGRHEPVLSLMFWLTILTSLGVAPLALPHWQPLSLGGHLAMFGVAFCGTLYGVLGITVLRRAPVRIKASCSFLALPLAFLAGLLFFGEQPTLRALLGGLLVLGGVTLALDQRRKPAGTPHISAEPAD